MKIKILLVFGTRPEAIKMAPIYIALKNKTDEFETLVCVTAQHREMLDQVIDIFNIDVDFDLDLMKDGQDLFDITSRTLIGMRGVLDKCLPDIVMVHGDTTTTLAAATASFYKNIPVWHVEAGLRTFDIKAPFPEEFNRQVVSKITTVHLAPTDLARKNLLSEGIDEADIFITGNTVIDALFLILTRIEKDRIKKLKIINDLNNVIPFNWQNEKFILITGHRRENFGEGFLEICNAIKELAMRYKSIQFVYPVHLNPNVQTPVNKILKGVENIHLIPPLEYESFLFVMKHCNIVITDSGGIQEEAPSLGKPVIVLRDVTERPEAVNAGTVKLVGANFEKIIKNVSMLLDNEKAYTEMSIAHNPYGDGSAAVKILSLLTKKYKE